MKFHKVGGTVNCHTVYFLAVERLTAIRHRFLLDFRFVTKSVISRYVMWLKSAEGRYTWIKSDKSVDKRINH